MQIKLIFTRKVLNLASFYIKSEGFWISETAYSRRWGKRRGLGPRNDVLTTCKAVNPRASQRSSKAAVCFLMIFNFGFERWIISKEFRILSPPAK